MDGWINRWMDGWIDGWMEGLMDGWMDGWIDGGIDVCRNEQMSEQIDVMKGLMNRAGITLMSKQMIITVVFIQ